MLDQAFSALITDAADNRVIRQRLGALRRIVSHIPMVDRAIDMVGPITRRLDPIVIAVDRQVSSVVNVINHASKPIITPNTNLPEISKERLMTDASQGRLIVRRLDDMNRVRMAMTNKFESGAGGVLRLLVHTLIAATSWWMAPILMTMLYVAIPFVAVMDQTIAKALVPGASAISARIANLTGSMMELVPFRPTPVMTGRSAQSMRDLIYFNIVFFAETVIEQTKLVKNKPRKTKITIKQAVEKLEALKNALEPRVPVMASEFQKRLVEGGMQEALDDLRHRFGKAFDRTKEMTNAALVHASGQDQRLAPVDFYKFYQMYVGKMEANRDYQERTKIVKELIDMLTNVLTITRSPAPSSDSSQKPVPSTAA